MERATATASFALIGAYARRGRAGVAIAALAFLLYPAVLALPRHAPAPAAHAAPRVAVSNACVEPGWPPAAPCAADAAEQATPRLPSLPLALLAALLLTRAAWWPAADTRARRHVWCWPRARRRALLQVFLI